MTPEQIAARQFASLRQAHKRGYRKPRAVFGGLFELADLPQHMTRRGVVKSFLLGFSGLTLGCAPTGKDSAWTDTGEPTTPDSETDPTIDTADSGTDTDTGEPTGDPASFGVSVWVQISEDDQVTVVIAKNEMGQGIATGLAMLVAEELDVPWSAVSVRLEGELDQYDLPGWSNGTWGSISLLDNYVAMLEIGAAAREMLVAAAAAAWGVDPAELSTADGAVSHPELGTLRYGELARAASKLPVPAMPALKDPSAYTLVGQPVERLDIAQHVRGETVYGIDVELEGMKYAAVKQSPVFGGELANFGALDISGTGAEALVEIPHGVAVVASSWWTAKKALDGLELEFVTAPEMAGLSSTGMSARFAADLDGAGTVSLNVGDPEAALDSVAASIQSEYEAPMLAHVAMEPLSCTASVTEDGCEVWVSTQYAEGVRVAVASATGIAAPDVTVHVTALGGGFGRKVETDYPIQAATISQAVGAPVKVIWSREEDIRHDYYRPPVRARLVGGVSAGGRIEAWIGRAAGCGLYETTAAWNAAGFNDFPYSFANATVHWIGSDLGLPFGYLRAPGHNRFNFMVEGFVDELAELAGVDAAQLRADHLEGNPRAAAVLDAVLAASSWGSPTVAGAAHGCGIQQMGTESYVALVAEVSVDDAKRVTVHKVWAAVDIGRVVNPEIVRVQVESCCIFSLSTGILGEITLTGGAVDQSNFHDYGLIKTDVCPEFEVVIIDSDEDPGGIGEHAVGPMISAVLNAMYRVTGERVRELPITRYGYSL